MTLTEFLLARIAEDEAVARAATPGLWRYNPAKEWHSDSESLTRARAGMLTFDGEEFVGAGPSGASVCVAATGPADHPQSMRDAEHIARHDPARVLADCEAKRRIVERFTWDDLGDEVSDPEGVLALLTLPFADHPDYREEWKP